MHAIQVHTQKPYKILIGTNIKYGKEIKPFIKTNAIIIHDANLPKKIVETITHSLKSENIDVSTLPLQQNGEDIKTFSSFEEVSTKLIELGTTRKTTLIALGGGTAGDFVGFIAATFMRGIPFIQIPTTLLSMVDSSVGGKVAINLGKYKNCIGAFYQPEVVLIDTTPLSTLPEIELVSGYAEVIKYGFITDKPFFNYLIENGSMFASFAKNRTHKENTPTYLTQIISRSCEIKAEVVCQDETETLGIREILNFGHTFAHAFEGLYLGKIPHGIAVGIGMIYACEFCQIETENICKHYEEVGLESSITHFCKKKNLPLPTATEIIALMQKDKKNTSNKIKLILLDGIGKATIKEVPSQDVLSFVQKMLENGR